MVSDESEDRERTEGERGTTVQGDTDRIPRYDVDPGGDSNNGWTTYGGNHKQTRHRELEEVFRAETVVKGVADLREEISREEKSPEESIGEASEEVENFVDTAAERGEISSLDPKTKRAAIFLLVAFVLGTASGDVPDQIFTEVFKAVGSGALAVEMYDILREAINEHTGEAG